MNRFGLAILLVLTTSPAFAQGMGMGIPIGQEREKSADEIERAKATEDAYKKRMKEIPNAKVSNDPWGSIRTEDKKPQAASQPKAAKKTGGTAAN